MKEGESEWERMESGHSPAKTYRMSYETPAELPKLSEKSELVRSSPFFQQNHPQLLLPLPVPLQGIYTSTYIQPADIGLPTGNGKKLSCTQAQLGQATGLAFASFLSISCWPSYVRRLYRLRR